MQPIDPRITFHETKDTSYGKELVNDNLKSRSAVEMDICSCCEKEMTKVEVLESYLDQRIEQALDLCDALSRSTAMLGKLELLGKIADCLVRAATITEAARIMTEGEQPVPDEG